MPSSRNSTRAVLGFADYCLPHGSAAYRMMRLRFCLLAACTLVLLWPQVAAAQTATGSIIGTITDSTGAVVSGAIVTVQSASTGTTQTRTTTTSGTYSIVALDPGDYSVKVESGGFQGVQANVHIL